MCTPMSGPEVEKIHQNYVASVDPDLSSGVLFQFQYVISANYLFITRLCARAFHTKTSGKRNQTGTKCSTEEPVA